MRPLNIPQYGIAWESSFDPRAMVQMKADTYNATPGSLTGYQCPLCRNRGNIAKVSDQLHLVVADCECLATRRLLKQAACSGMESLTQMTFDSFRAVAPWQKQMLKLSRAYADAPEGWLVLCGQSGSGKTHLCAAVCNALLKKGMTPKYFAWREHIVQLKGLACEYDRQQALMREFKEARLLYIDDLFKCGGNPTAADISLGFELLNYRYLRKMPTVISTELHPGQLGALDEAIASRIMEMAKDHLMVIERGNDKNYRLRAGRNS